MRTAVRSLAVADTHSGGPQNEMAPMMKPCSEMMQTTNEPMKMMPQSEEPNG